ncbi:epoxide hydrolase N-terminal domain-containing protein [Actinoplanes sp. NPDC049265]|uniref:epoxide hydrolase N-terminal domain-containing protein n=1 Tax=Actinoplanes sp. NPDC049265 TaxID=3363902 RepID=UPI003715139F
MGFGLGLRQPPGSGLPLDPPPGPAGDHLSRFDRGCPPHLPQFVTDVYRQTVHFAHVRSAAPAATPLLISHDLNSPPSSPPTSPPFFRTLHA